MENRHGTILKSPYEAAPTLMKVGPKAVEQDGQSRDMEGVPDKHLFTVQSKYGGALTKDWNKGVVSHADAEIRHPLVKDEGGCIQEHMVGGASVGNHQTLRIP